MAMWIVMRRYYCLGVIRARRIRHLCGDSTSVESPSDLREEAVEEEEGRVVYDNDPIIHFEGVKSDGDTERVKVNRKKSLCLPTISMPRELQDSVDTVLSSSVSRKSCIRDGKELADYLQKRVPPDSGWSGKDLKTDNWVNSSRERLEAKKGGGSERLFNSKYNPNSVWANKASIKDGIQQGKGSKLAPQLKYQKRESMAFLSGRTPASYGTALRVLSEISTLNKSYSPRTLLDFGSGIGTVEWAAHQLWKDSIYEYQCVDISNAMLEMAKHVRLGGYNTDDMLEVEKETHVEHIKGVYSRQYLPLSRNVKYDIVVSGHTLGELSSSKLRSFAVATLWRKTNDYLVLIEPGTWSGYKIIMEARDLILGSSKWIRFENETAEDLEGHVFSPCPHDHQCPLLRKQEYVPKKPCHFAQRIQLSSSEKNTPLKRRGHRIENFSYIVFKKGARDAPADSDHVVRLLEPVKKRSRHIICKMCTSEGKMEENILTKKKHGELYKEGRKCQWGDIFDFKRP